MANSNAAPQETATDVMTTLPIDTVRAPAADIDGLATSLLDLATGYESALRTVLSVQRLLERVRRCGETSGEGTLLVQEMGRKLVALREGESRIDSQLEDATLHLAELQPPS